MIKGGGLLIYLYHSVDDALGTYNDNWYNKVLQDSLQKQLDTLVSVQQNVWITTFGNALKYHKEANCATLSEIGAFNGSQRIIQLTDTLSNNSIYDQSLSIKLKMNGINYKSISQNGNSLKIDSVYNDTIQFHAVPDGGQIILDINLAPTGINEFEWLDHKINVYPNPMQKIVTVSYNNIKINQISIANTIGQIIYLNEIINENIFEKVDISELEKGVYFIKINTDNGNIVKKIIKE